MLSKPNSVSKCLFIAKAEQRYLVRKWLGLVTLTDEAFIRGSKLGSIVVDVKDPNGHRDFGFLMPVVWKERIETVNMCKGGIHVGPRLLLGKSELQPLIQALRGKALLAQKSPKIQSMPNPMWGGCPRIKVNIRPVRNKPLFPFCWGLILNAYNGAWPPQSVVHNSSSPSGIPRGASNNLGIRWKWKFSNPTQDLS